MNAPASASASTTSTRSGSPYTISAEPRRIWTALRTSSRWARLASAPMRTSGLAGLPTVILASRARDRRDDLVRDRGGHDRPADRGALLAGLDRHLGDDALDVQVELRIVGRDVGAEDRAVERVGLDAELRAAVQDRRVLAQGRAGARRAGEGDGVLRAELVEQALGAAAQQLQRSFRHQAGLDDAADHELGQVCRLARRLDDRGEPGEERGCELLEHAPDREVEGIDLHRDAGPRGPEVLAEEHAGLAELLGRPVEDHGVVGQLAGALAGIAEHRADAAVDVDLGVAERRAGARRQGVERVLVLAEVLGDGLEDAGALVERQRTDRRPADVAGVVDHRRQVEPGRRDPGDLFAGGRVEEGQAVVGGTEPRASGIAFEQCTHGSGPFVCHALREPDVACKTITDRSVSKWLLRDFWRHT